MQNKLCKLKFEHENSNFLTKCVLMTNFFFSTLFLIIHLFEAVNTCFLLMSRKLAVILLKMTFLKNPRWRTCCEAYIQSLIFYVQTFGKSIVFHGLCFFLNVWKLITCEQEGLADLTCFSTSCSKHVQKTCPKHRHNLEN